MKKFQKGILLLSMIALASCGNTAHQHHLIKVEANPPTCIYDGNETYYRCTDETCQKLFLDEEGKNETTLEDVTLSKTGIHQGGQATCQSQAICDICHQPYGDLGSHAYVREIVDDRYLAQAASA